MKHTVITALAIGMGISLLAACGGPGGGSGDGGEENTVTLVTHDSFAASQEVWQKFTDTTGYQVEILRAGDAGSAVNQAVLNKGNPQGDVFFGVDNTLLSRALKAGIFTPYEAEGLAKVPDTYQLDGERHRVTPVDTGQICVNYDRSYFAERGMKPPRTFSDLIKPRYQDLLVTENPATSSPGLGFLLATIEKFGDGSGPAVGGFEGGWKDYWKKLRQRGVEVVDGWEQAYNDRFSGSRAGKGTGERPLVVSYASSPPAEVLGKKPRPERAPTGVAKGTCFRQIEFAGLLKGAENEKGGKALIDFLLSETFQEDLPLRMFVHPVRDGVSLPEVFTRYGANVQDPVTMAPEKIAGNREQWVKAWTSLVLR